MFVIFTRLADWVTFALLGLTADSKLGDALHFFVEDVTKIFVLLRAVQFSRIVCLTLVKRVYVVILKRKKSLSLHENM